MCRGRPLTSQTAFGGQLPYKGSLVRPVARFHHIPFEYNGRLLRVTNHEPQTTSHEPRATNHGLFHEPRVTRGDVVNLNLLPRIGDVHGIHAGRPLGVPYKCDRRAVRPLFYFLFPAEEDFDGQGGEPDVAGQDVDDAVPAGFPQVMVAPYHVGEVDGDEKKGDDARGDGVFQGLWSALRGQVLEPDDEADGQDTEQAEVEIAFAADFAFEV